MFTSRHYRALAQVFWSHFHARGQGVTAEGEELAVRMADMLAVDSPSFKRERFLRACGIPA